MGLEIGKINLLTIDKITEEGVLLKAGGGVKETIKLSNDQFPDDKKAGDTIEVFIYRDSQDKIAATTRKPYGLVGELAYLKVIDITPIGAFMDLGLEKDLFLPKSEQTTSIAKDNRYLVKIYVDKSNRLCASMRIDDDLKSGGDYKPGEMVKGTVYGVNPRLGVFVAIDNLHYGFVHISENYKGYKIGDKDVFRVVKEREDGRINLSTRKLAYQQIDEDANEIVKLIIKNKGFLPLHDKSTPEEIKEYLNVSKNAFKRAIGKLLKEKIITQDEYGVKFTEGNKYN
ncbi:CvfB family protein [Alkaliphilus pronyensis]|uniref:CvfB family protein n=1 Tax=Alkaliphilus pronyensis TaxID=1482732 RepID=UPI00186580E5|nr:S1-like domain-containing RNA-binding protein [Alkaliphilus pronyensis]